MIYLDTSAFLKLYVREAESQNVQDLVQSQDEPIPVWDILEAEFTNALRLKVFRNELLPEEAVRLSDLFEDRLRRGQYQAPEIDRHLLRKDFKELSEQTALHGYRTLDLLHVACAVQLKPAAFLTFDARQKQLAVAAGLTLP